MLAVTRHSWASYSLRNVCHGLETYPVYMRSVPQAMFISEILSRITHHRLDIDRIAMAHCQCAIPPIPHPTRKQAISALADEFYEYMSGLINDPPDNTAAAPDQLSNHRITQLEQELAATKALLQTRQSEIHPPSTPPTKRQAPPSPDQTPAPTPNTQAPQGLPMQSVKIHLHPFQPHLPQPQYKIAQQRASSVARFKHSFPAHQRSPHDRTSSQHLQAPPRTPRS